MKYTILFVWLGFIAINSMDTQTDICQSLESAIQACYEEKSWKSILPFCNSPQQPVLTREDFEKINAFHINLVAAKRRQFAGLSLSKKAINNPNNAIAGIALFIETRLKEWTVSNETDKSVTRD